MAWALSAVAAPAQKDRANRELIRYVSKSLGRRVLIKSGATSREKTLKIE